MNNTDIISIGIDIGTSTTQVIFSRLRMQNTSGYFAVPHISIVEKEVIYKSDIYRTPLENEYLINTDKVSEIVSSEFNKSGFTPNDTKTGAVIITGESARKENSAAVLDKLSRFAGDFVVSTAGPDLESVIAGKGSGAQKYSEEHSCVTANLDIGGGTTNIVIFDCGKVIGKGCADIGGRQIILDSDFKVKYISKSAEKIATSLGIAITKGSITDLVSLNKICTKMSELLEQMLGLSEQSELLSQVITSGSSELIITKPVKAVCFSGGVADCIYKTEHEPLQYGDIGVCLGNAVRAGKLFGVLKVVDAKETIRATVVGAGTYTTTISGSTISYSENALPLKNIPVLKLNKSEQDSVFNGDNDFLLQKIKWFMAQNDVEQFILAMDGKKNPTYYEMVKCAKCICECLSEVIHKDSPLLVLVESDMAKALGQVMRRVLPDKRTIVSIDSISVEDNDYIDLGKPLMDGLVIPVVVKTLIFG